MFFEALYFAHFLSFYTMQLEPPKSYSFYLHLPTHTIPQTLISGDFTRMV